MSSSQPPLLGSNITGNRSEGSTLPWMAQPMNSEKPDGEVQVNDLITLWIMMINDDNTHSLIQNMHI